MTMKNSRLIHSQILKIFPMAESCQRKSRFLLVEFLSQEGHKIEKSKPTLKKYVDIVPISWA